MVAAQWAQTNLAWPRTDRPNMFRLETPCLQLLPTILFIFSALQISYMHLFLAHVASKAVLYSLYMVEFITGYSTLQFSSYGFKFLI